jgi:Ca2+-binding RTX toxin-like protein
MSNAMLFEVATANASSLCASPCASNTLVVIDTSVKDYEILAAGVIAGTVVVLESNRDGIEQITVALHNYPSTTNLHIVAHGASGTLFLGKSQLNRSNCDRYADQLKQWFNKAADLKFSLLLYACNVAAGDAGLEFLAQLQHYTGASIAASTTRIGNAVLGGNWELDAHIGEPTAALAFDPEILKTYPGVLISTVSIAATDTTAAETGSNTGNFRISLSAVTATDLTINYSIATGTGQATNGTDYDTLSGTAVVLAGTSFVDVKVTPIDDADSESAEAISLTLLPSANYTLGGQITAIVTITSSDLPPTVANAIADQSATEDAAFSFTFSATAFNDVDGNNTLTYSATLEDGSLLPGWLNFNAATRTFSGTPLNSNVGAINVKVTASDGTGSVSDTFALTVANTNDAPTVANPIADQSATEDSNFSFVVPANSFNDVDKGDILTYSATLEDGTPLPSWLTFNAATRTFSGTPSNSEVGVINVKVTASDGTGSVSDTFALTVANTNDAPTVANPIADQSATEDANFSFVIPANSFNDVDKSDSLIYTATLANSAALPSWLTFNAATRTFSGTPTNSEVGAIDIKVTASDGTVAVNDTFTLTVVNTNDAPTVANAIIDRIATEDTAFSFTLPTNTFKDVDTGTVLSYSATLSTGSPLPAWLQFNAATGTFSGTPTNAEVGMIDIKVTASDSVATVSDTFTLTVSNTNDAPTLTNAIADQTATEDTAFSFTVPANSFGDVDAGDVLTYSATLSNGVALPTWLTFDPATRTFSGTPTNAEVGAIDIKVKATDKAGATAEDTFFVTTLNTNDAPTIANAIADQTASEDIAFSFTVPTNSFGDVDAGDVLTYSATRSDGTPLPTWLTFNTTTRTFSGTPTNAEVGSFDIKVRATDGASAIAEDIFTLTVNNTNDAPTLTNAIADQTATEDTAFSFTVPANSFGDVDAGDVLTYSATLSNGVALPTWLTFDPATRTFSGTPTNAEVGSLNLKIKATDKAGATAEDTFFVTTLNTNDAPTIANAIADQTTIAATAFSLTVPANTFSDVDGDTLTYSATLASNAALPAWLTFDPMTRTFSGTPTLADVGNLSIRLTAADSTTSVSDLFTLDVIANTAPTLTNPIADQTAPEDVAFNFAVPINTFSDADAGDKLTYTATLATGAALPDWLTFDATTQTFSGTPTNDNIDSLNLKVAAIDRAGEAVEAPFVLIVANVNDAPIISGTPLDAVAQDIPYNFTPLATDIDAGTHLTFSILNKPDWATFDPATGKLSGTPKNLNVGITKNVTIGVDDGVTATSLPAFNLTVTNVNDSPIIGQALSVDMANQTTFAAFPYSFKLPENAFVDPDAGDKLTLSATQENGNPLPNWLKFNARTLTFSGTPNIQSLSKLSLKVTATDGSGIKISQSFQLEVAQPIGKTGIAVPDISFAKHRGSKAGIQRQGGDRQDILRGAFTSDTLRGGGGDDLLIGGNGRLLLGTDRLFGGEGNDRLFGGAGNDYLDGSTGNDRLQGGKGRDLLLGGVGDDVLIGSRDADILVGGAGADLLNGGQGKDMFVFQQVQDGTDTIVDFIAADDLIDLRPLFAQPQFAGITPYARYAQYINLVQVGGNTEVRVDEDGSGDQTKFVTLVTILNISSNAITPRNFVIS